MLPASWVFSISLHWENLFGIGNGLSIFQSLKFEIRHLLNLKNKHFKKIKHLCYKERYIKHLFYSVFSEKTLYKNYYLRSRLRICPLMWQPALYNIMRNNNNARTSWRYSIMQSCCIRTCFEVNIYLHLFHVVQCGVSNRNWVSVLI